MSFQVDNQTRKRRIECKPELVISSLQRFYSSHPEINKVIDYLTGDAPLSLRIIDWFVTKYSRKNFVRYTLNGHDFPVYLNYKGQLKAYSKQYFDPNCRRERIMFKIQGYEQFLTTIGKLNFFRWALESKILDYIQAHEEEIRSGYNTYLKETTQAQKKSKSNDTASSSSSTDSNTSSITTISCESSATNGTIATETTQVSSGTRTTRRRRNKQTPSSLNRVQFFSTPIELDFN